MSVRKINVNYKPLINENSKLTYHSFSIKDNKLTGICKCYHTNPDNELEEIMLIDSHFNDKSEGKCIMYHESGSISTELTFSKNIQIGYMTRYHANGNIISKSFYYDFIENGFTSGYTFKGKLKYIGYCIIGMRNGYFILFDDNGNIKESRYYIDNEKIYEWI